MVRMRAVIGFLAATAVFLWLTGVLASSGWAGPLRVLAAIPMTMVWVATTVILIETSLERPDWPTPAWLGALGAAGSLIAVARLVGLG